ncbi:MAG: hypothetical protein M3T56_13330 [Chloroflexota bacterium]|nr:hypothetical protein [Chloroflexota bacterium]
MAVATGVGLGWVSIGVGVLGATVAVADGEALGEVEGEALADGAATCWEAITAAPRSNNATSATAAKTVKTVDQRSAGRRTPPKAAAGRSR